MMMRRILVVAALGIAGLAACSNDTVAPADFVEPDADVTYLLPDYALSAASVVDGAGIGGARLPRELQLTEEQKAEIAALHEAFREDHADEIAELHQIEKQIRELRRSGGTRAEILALAAQAKPILEQLAADFAELRQAIWNVYTNEQKAWIEAHRRPCDHRGPPRLTDEQIAEIRALKQAFMDAMADEIRAIKEAHQEARAAKQAGASAEEIRAILASVKDEMEALRQAEARLHDAIQDVLTDDQRRRMCDRN